MISALEEKQREASEAYAQKPARRADDLRPVGSGPGQIPWRAEGTSYLQMARDAARIMREGRFDEFGWSAEWM